MSLSINPGEITVLVVVVTFLFVIAAIAFNLLDMVLAAMIGVSVLTVAGAIDMRAVLGALRTGGPTLELLAAGMVLVRILQPTGLFERVGGALGAISRGDGRLFVVAMVALVAPLCAVLPNATVVMLMAPAVIVAARRLGTNVVPPIVLLVVISNSAGLLTLVGDPATFVVGSAIGMSFADYLASASLGGLLVVLSIIPIAAVAMRGLWGVRAARVSSAPTPIANPLFVAACLAVFVLQVVLFVVGDALTQPLAPPAVAFLGATLSLLVLSSFRVEPIGAVLRDIDWHTLVFLGLMFLMVQGLVDSGALNPLADGMVGLFGTRLSAVGLFLLVFVALASSLVPNVPMAATMVFVTKVYFVNAGLVPEEASGAGFTAWPEASLPVFMAMMFGATLGGNATMIGASSNLVAVGILKREGTPITFARFARYGVPITAAQLALAAAYIFVIVPWLR